MPKFPVISSRRLVKFFQDNGFTKDRQNGDHIILEKDGIARPVVIPDKERVGIGIIKNNLKTAGISEKTFRDAMQNSKKEKKDK